MKRFSSHSISRGFTLVEMVVSLTILAILLLALAQMFNATSGTIKGSGGHLDADSQARAIFDRMAADLAGMSKRPDIDFSFLSQAGNDQFFFYSEAPAFLPAQPSSTVQSPVSFVGYKISVNYQLERLGYGLNWDGAGASVTQLTFPAASAFTPSPTSTINDAGTGSGNEGAWRTVINKDNAADNNTGTNYQVTGDMVFRMEFCFLLKDGTYSTMPVEANAPSTWPTGNAAPIFFSTESGPPTTAADSTQKLAAGSRWWDQTNNRAYICLSSAVGTAVWRPLGWDDTAGVVVTLALLDDGARQILTASGKTLAQATALLPDITTGNLSASTPQLMATTWNSVVSSSSFAASAGFPPGLAQVRIYQRCLYLDNSIGL